MALNLHVAVHASAVKLAFHKSLYIFSTGLVWIRTERLGESRCWTVDYSVAVEPE